MSDLTMALESLAEDEGLTSNLTDDLARALLKWAEERIIAGVSPALVRAAARAANRDDLSNSEAVVKAAMAALEQAAGSAQSVVQAAATRAIATIPQPLAPTERQQAPKPSWNRRMRHRRHCRFTIRNQ